LAKIEEDVETLLEGKIQSLGYELYDVEYVKEGKNYILRIYIDKPEGININDCEIVNNGITDMLDEADYIKEQYILEVSSPGIERTLKKDKHLEQNIGEEIEIKLFKKDENSKKEYRGILKEFDSEYITIQTDENIKINRKNIAHIKTIYNW
jgi:ribosome maturation factor RimP